MKNFGVYTRVVQVLKHQLLATVPKEYLPEFEEYVFSNNAARFSIQSICMVLMDAGLLILYLFRMPVYKPATVHMILLVAKMILMGNASYALAKIEKQPYNPANLLHKTLDTLFPVVYIICDVLVCVTGPHSIGNYMRLFAIPIIVGSITVISQVKSSIILFIMYAFFYFWIPNMDGVALLSQLASAYNLWFVVFATTLSLSASVYSQFVNNFMVTNQLKKTGEEYSLLNSVLEREIDQRSKLLHTVNLISDELLSSGSETFDTMLYRSMERIGTALEIDKVYIWSNSRQGEELFCSQVNEWTRVAEPQQSGDQTTPQPFPHEWLQTLSENKCINNITRVYSDDLRHYLQGRGILSIILVPVFIRSEFWGFVGFADCRNERLFTDIEEAILRTVSLLFATSVLRNEMTSDLIRTTEIALAASNAKSDFLANISHEIRTPLNAITGMSSIARKSDSIDDIYLCLDRINAAVKQLLSIINDVLDMSKNEAGKIDMMEEPFNLVSTLHNVISIMFTQAEQKQLSFITELSSDLPEAVVGDETRLSQILINLLSNAIKFTPKGGRVSFSAEIVESLSDDHSLDGYAHLVFTIQDTGIGIAAETLPKLFNKFEQADAGISREFGGTGLGLAITKRIAEMMHGNIEVVSVLNEGSCFTAHVLLLKTSDEMAIIREGTERAPTKNTFADRRALLVEDIEINREIIIAMLDDTGIQIDIAENGRMAVDIFEGNAEKYDIIFMDLQMPIMDGYTATEHIRALDVPTAKSVPILAMTANAFAEDIRKCIDSGMNDHISKPIDYTGLIDKIRKHLH